MCRWKHASEQMDGLNIRYTRVPAIDGTQLSKDELEYRTKKRDILHRWIRDLSLYEIGCCLSHRKAWELVAQGGYHGGFIFEDDFIIDSNFVVVMQAISKLQIARPVLIKLYIPGSDVPWHYNSGRLLSKPLVGDHRLILPMIVQWGALAYYVNRPAASQLVHITECFNRPVDDIIRRQWETGVMVLHVMPGPVRHADGPSIIDPSRLEAQINAHNSVHTTIFYSEFGVMNMMHIPARFLRARRIFSEISQPALL